MSMIDTDMVRQALIATTKASGHDEVFYDILIPVDDGRTENPLKIGQLFGVDLLQHPDVPDGQMYIKKKPAMNYKPQDVIDDLMETKSVLRELMDRRETPGTDAKVKAVLKLVDDEINHWQNMIVRGPHR